MERYSWLVACFTFWPLPFSFHNQFNLLWWAVRGVDVILLRGVNNYMLRGRPQSHSFRFPFVILRYYIPLLASWSVIHYHSALSSFWFTSPFLRLVILRRTLTFSISASSNISVIGRLSDSHYGRWQTNCPDVCLDKFALHRMRSCHNHYIYNVDEWGPKQS